MSCSGSRVPHAHHVPWILILFLRALLFRVIKTISMPHLLPQGAWTQDEDIATWDGVVVAEGVHHSRRTTPQICVAKHGNDNAIERIHRYGLLSWASGMLGGFNA